LSNTLINPLFSATNTRLSAENATTVGFTRPEKTTDSLNPAGSVAAPDGDCGAVKPTRMSADMTMAASDLRTRHSQKMTVSYWPAAQHAEATSTCPGYHPNQIPS
jgi:hypothetical protein